MQKKENRRITAKRIIYTKRDEREKAARKNSDEGKKRFEDSVVVVVAARAHEVQLSQNEWKKGGGSVCAARRFLRRFFFFMLPLVFVAFVSWHVNWLNAPFRCEWGRNEKMAIIHFSLGFSLFFLFFFLRIPFGSFGRAHHVVVHHFVKPFLRARMLIHINLMCSSRRDKRKKSCIPILHTLASAITECAPAKPSIHLLLIVNRCERTMLNGGGDTR